MKDLKKEIEEIRDDINGIEAYNYSGTTDRIIERIETLLKEERKKTLEEVIKMEAFETSQDSGENYGSGVIIVDEVKEKLKLLKEGNEKERN